MKPALVVLFERQIFSILNKFIPPPPQFLKVGICNLHIFYRKPYLLSKLSSFFVRLRCCQYVLYLIWHNQVNLVFLCLKIKTLNNLHAYKQREFYINKKFLMIFHLSSKFHIIRNVVFSDGSGSRNWISGIKNQSKNGFLKIS